MVGEENAFRANAGHGVSAFGSLGAPSVESDRAVLTRAGPGKSAAADVGDVFEFSDLVDDAPMTVSATAQRAALALVRPAAASSLPEAAGEETFTSLDAVEADLRPTQAPTNGPYLFTSRHVSRGDADRSTTSSSADSAPVSAFNLSSTALNTWSGAGGEAQSPGERVAVRINFQPAGYNTSADYAADVGLAFGQQSTIVAGQTLRYGWVTEASVADGTSDGTVPLSISAQSPLALNDRTDEIAGLDARQGTYAHLALSGYMARGAWEVELANGWYEVTAAVGDTSGAFDSRHVINAEGRSFSAAFIPFRPADFPADADPSDDTQGFRSDLVTRLVEVRDGRLTLDSIGGVNTKLQYVDIEQLPDLTPGDARPAPADYASFTSARASAGVGPGAVEVDLGGGARPTGVDPASDFFIGVSVVEGRGGALLASLSDGSIRLVETLTGSAAAITANTTAGFDSLTITPVDDLKPFTSYTLVIDGFQDRGEIANPDAPSRDFQTFTRTFVTGEATEAVAQEVAFRETMEVDGAADGAFLFTSLEMSPDGTKLYVATMTGEIKRFDVDPVSGALSGEQTLSLPYFQTPEGPRGIVGLAFDPVDPNVLWVTDNNPIPLSGRDNGVPDFSGRVSRVTLAAGPGFSGVAEAYITGLPRSNGDHVTNSLEFRANPDAASDAGAPSHLLYVVQGSNTAIGEADSAWGLRPERLLNAAVLEIDPTRTPPLGGFDVATEPLPADGLNRRFADTDGDLKNGGIAITSGPLQGHFLHFDARGVASIKDGGGRLVQAYYDPFADDAVLKVFATGARNAYDLVWHSDGRLYVPTNGSGPGGRVPDIPTTPADERLLQHGTQQDHLLRVSEGGFYGHPNTLRGEYVLNGGNPTSGADSNEVTSYPVGVRPDSDYVAADAYALGRNRSPNGVIEYTSDVFGSNLRSHVLFTEYSGGNDIRSIKLDAEGRVLADDVLRNIDGEAISYVDPLDLIQGAGGRLYLLTLNRETGQSQIVRLDPAPNKSAYPPSGPTTILTIQAEDNTPGDGTAVSIPGPPAQIVIRSMDRSEPNPERPVFINGLRPGAFGRDGNTVDDDGETGGYADFGATNADRLTFRFDLTDGQAGEAVLRVRFANGGTADRPLQVLVNDVVTGVTAFTPPPGVTGEAAWSVWRTVDIPAQLVSGSNTVTFKAVAGTGPNIDQLEIVRSPNEPEEPFAFYEAEAAVLAGGAVVVPNVLDDRGAEGTGFVDFDGAADQSVTWSVTADVVGGYEIGFRYALATGAPDRPLDLTVNGVDFGPVNFVGRSNAGETEWYFAATNVRLEEGSNTIRLTAPGGVGPHLDQLRVETEPSDTFVPIHVGVDVETRIELEDGASARVVGPRTSEFFFEVERDGWYALDLASNAGAANGGELRLLLNGRQVGTVGFPGQGTAGERTVHVELRAGVPYDLRVLSAADGANTLDYLDVRQAGDPNADIHVQSRDAAFFDNRLHFSWIDNPAGEPGTPVRDFKESAQVRISNTGSTPLSVLDYEIAGPFKLSAPSQLDGLRLAPGQFVNVNVLFDRAAYTAPTGTSTQIDQANGVFTGALKLTTNDADTPAVTVDLAGFWQRQDEANQEPNVNEVWKVFGFGNFIEGLSTRAGGASSVLNRADRYEMSDPTEVLSPYWRLADGVAEARITQIAAFHGPGGERVGIHGPGDKGTANQIQFWNHGSAQNQTVLPLLGNGGFATTVITRERIPDAWLGDDVFGIEVAGLSTDPRLNPVGSRVLPGVQQGYTVRMFQAVDAQGVAIPNTFLGIMDYTGGNYDYNDNLFVIEGVAPVGASPAPAAAGPASEDFSFGTSSQPDVPRTGISADGAAAKITAVDSRSIEAFSCGGLMAEADLVARLHADDWLV